MSSLPLPRSVLDCDVIGSSDGSRARQAHLDEGLRAVVADAIADVPARFDAAGWFTKPNGDGCNIVVPGSVPKAWLAADFIRSLQIQLRQRNRFGAEDSRLRLRVAMTHGDVTVRDPQINGSPVTEAARLVNSDALRNTVLAYPRADLFLIVSERFFIDVVAEEDLDLDRTAFDRVSVTERNYHGTAYIRRPRFPDKRDGEGGGRHAPPPPPPDSTAPENNVVTAYGSMSQAAGRDIIINHR